MNPRSSKSATDLPRILSPRTAREVAYDVLAGTELDDLPTRQIETTLERSPVSPADRALAMELVYGVIRRRATLDAIIAPHVLRPWDRVEEGLKLLMRLGCYQLVCLRGIAAHAAVHETVSLAARCGQPRWTGFLNAILRAVSQQVLNEFVSIPGPDCVPVGNEFRKLAAAVLPDPIDKPADYFAAAYSFPKWLAARWSQRMTFDELCAVGKWFNKPPQLCLRVNTTRSDRETLLCEWNAAGIDCVAGDHPQSIWLHDSQSVERLPGFKTGLFCVQDESAMQAATLLAPLPNSRVLDLCAAPGGKTTHLAELMSGTGEVLAVDVSDDRLQFVRESAERLGLANINCLRVLETLDDLPAGPFDSVLVDVPCSNTGVFGKRPEARWRIQPRDFVELVATQRRLLNAAATVLRSGGRLVYSTCSIEPAENRELVNTFINDQPELQLETDAQHSPGSPGDGAYQALLIKR